MARIQMYVGQEDGDSDVEEYLYVGLRVADREIILYKSEDALDSLSEDGLLTEIERGLNEVILYRKELNLSLELDEDEFLVYAEELGESTVKKVEKIFDELREEF